MFMRLIITLAIAIYIMPATSEIIMIQRATVPAAHGMYVVIPNNVWLSDTFKKLGSPSKVYNSDGHEVNIAPTGRGISGIAKHPKQDLFSFCDVMGSEIHWNDLNGKQVRSISLSNAWNARWSPSGNVMFAVTYGGSVVRITEENDEVVSGLDAPFDIAPIGETEFWVSEQGEVGTGRVCRYAKLTHSSTYKKIVCNQNIELDNPEGLWARADGSVVVVDTGSGTLVKINPDGSSIVLAHNLGAPILVQLLDAGKWVIFTNQSAQGPALIFGYSKELE